MFWAGRLHGLGSKQSLPMRASVSASTWPAGPRTWLETWERLDISHVQLKAARHLPRNKKARGRLVNDVQVAAGTLCSLAVLPLFQRVHSRVKCLFP